MLPPAGASRARAAELASRRIRSDLGVPARRPDRTNAATDTPRALSQYHPGATVTQVVGSTNFPPSFAAVGYAPCFKGFGCATPPLLDRPHLRVPIDEPRRRAPSPRPDLAPPPLLPPRALAAPPRDNVPTPDRTATSTPSLSSSARASSPTLPAAPSNTSPSSRTSSSPPTATTPRASTYSTSATGPRNR